MAEFLQENKVHDLIMNNSIIKEGVASVLGITNNYRLIHEDEYINGIIADFTLIHNDKIRSIIEVKGGKINITDYVRGIGQIFQYEYFNEKNISLKSIPYDDDFNTLYAFPSSVISNNPFNIGRFKYPKSTIILEINEKSNAVRAISQEELNKLAKATENNIVTISQYYLRDNRIFEYYILLKLLLFFYQIGITSVNRKNIEKNFLVKINSVNNGNWRNAFISLSSLGFITSQNMLTPIGKSLAILDYEEFAEKIYTSYISNYANEIIKCFDGNNSVRLNNSEFSEKIRNRYKNRDVLFLTQSSNRYISSWLNIFKDDYGFIAFDPRKDMRTLVYNPLEITKETFHKKIKENSIAYEYIKRYEELIKNGEWRNNEVYGI